MSVWVVTLHRFEHHEVSGAISRRHNEVTRLDAEMSPPEVARFIERWYAEHYQRPQWMEGAEIDERSVIWDGGDIDVGSEPKLTARLVEDPPPAERADA